MVFFKSYSSLKLNSQVRSWNSILVEFSEYQSKDVSYLMRRSWVAAETHSFAQ